MRPACNRQGNNCETNKYQLHKCGSGNSFNKVARDAHDAPSCHSIACLAAPLCLQLPWLGKSGSARTPSAGPRHAATQATKHLATKEDADYTCSSQLALTLSASTSIHCQVLNTCTFRMAVILCGFRTTTSQVHRHVKLGTCVAVTHFCRTWAYDKLSV